MIYRDKYLILDGKFPFGINKVIKHKEVTILPWTYENYIFCLNNNIKNLPSPMETFNWYLSPLKPYDHQKITSNFLVLNERAFCWNEAGTGKSASCVWAYCYLIKNHPSIILNPRMMIVCPLSTVKSVWSKEIFMIAPYLHVAEILGSRDRKIKLLKKDPQVIIVNHDGIKSLNSELKKWNPAIIIIDESTAFKNARTDRWRALRNLVKDTAYLWLLSGTPAPQAPTDLYAQARLVCPEKVGRSFLRFRDLVMRQASQYSWVAKPDWQNIIKDVIQPVIRFSREDCIDLPAVVEQNYEVSLSLLQKQTFATLRKRAVVLTQEGTITAVNEGVMRNKLLQCCAGYVYLIDDTTGERITKDLNPDNRIRALLDLVNETDRGVLVFAPFLNAIKFISKHFNANKILYDVITGEVSVKKRSIIFNKFQKGEIKVLIAHPKTMAHGVTLTYADTVIWYLVTSDNELYEQANSRIQRIGQYHKMRIIQLLSTNLEQNVLKRLKQKQTMQGVLLETLGQNKL